MTPDEPRRPDPDALLAEAAKAGRGRLKVFLGMAPAESGEGLDGRST